MTQEGPWETVVWCQLCIILFSTRSPFLQLLPHQALTNALAKKKGTGATAVTLFQHLWLLEIGLKMKYMCNVHTGGMEHTVFQYVIELKREKGSSIFLSIIFLLTQSRKELTFESSFPPHKMNLCVCVCVLYLMAPPPFVIDVFTWKCSQLHWRRVRKLSSIKKTLYL